MNFSKDQKEKVTVITSNVEKLDAQNAPELKAELLYLNKHSVSNIIVDLSATRYCDSSGLSSILVGNRLCKTAGGTFVVCGLQPAVKKLVEISQLDKVLNIVPTASEAEDMVYMSDLENQISDDK